MDEGLIYKLYVYVMLAVIFLMSLDIQSNILTSIKVLSLQCKSTYTITIPDDEGVEDWEVKE